MVVCCPVFRFGDVTLRAPAPSFRAMSPRAFAGVLQDLAGRMTLRRYQKHPRGEKKPRILPKVDPHKHVSTAQLLARQKEQRNSSGP